MLGIVAWRRGTGVLRLTKAEAVSSIVVGILLPGANSLLFVTEQQVPIGLASLIIAAIPLWVLLLRIAHALSAVRNPVSLNIFPVAGSFGALIRWRNRRNLTGHVLVSS